MIQIKKSVACLLLLSIGLVPRIADAAAPQRIVSLAPNITEILYAIGLEKNIVAVSDYCDRPAGAALKPKVGGISNPSVEKIISLKPDIVIMTTDGNPRDVNSRLLKLGIRTYIFRARRINELPDEIRGMGSILGAGAAAGRLAAKFEKTMARLRSKSPSGAGKVVFIIQPEPLIVAASGNAIQDALEILGWTNIAAGIGTKYTKFSVEELVRQSPDVILIGMGHPRMVEDSRNFLKRIKIMPAVQSGRVYFTSDALFRLGPRVIEGIEELAQILNKKQ